MAATQVVQGKSASQEEYHVAIALHKLHWPFVFQVSFAGGRRLRGGSVIDFVVKTVPETPLFVDGEYWHRSAQSERDKIARLMLVADSNGRFAQPVVLLGSQCNTQEAADAAISQEFGRYN